MDIVAATWWTYLDTDWLDVKWRRLLFVAERDAFARLYVDTTNGIELVWRVFKYDWLLHKRVATYATAFRLLFGLPWDRDSALLSLTGRVLFTLVQIRGGLVRPPLRRRAQAFIDSVTPFLQRADADPDFMRRDSIHPCWGVIAATSSQFASVRNVASPLYDALLATSTAVTLPVLTDERLKMEQGRNDQTAVFAAVQHVKCIVSGAAAAEYSVALRRVGTRDSVRSWEEPASSCDDAVGAILPAIAPDYAAQRFAIIKTLLDAANSSGNPAFPCDAAQRDFECFRSSGRRSGRSKQALMTQGASTTCGNIVAGV